MTSIHDDLDLISRVDGWGALTWPHDFLASHEAPRRGMHSLTRFVDLALSWHERARQRRSLLRLDDRMLRDIGVGRGTAQAEGQKPFWRP